MDSTTVMGIILFFVIIVFIFATMNMNVKQSGSNEEKHLYISMIDYVGGNDKIVSQVKTVMKMYKTDIEVTFCKGTGTIKETIPFSKITNIEVLNQEQLSSNVTLSRLLLLGVFAFAFKKDKLKVQYFIVINYLDKNNNEKKLIYTMKNDLQRNLDCLNNYRNRWNEQNKIDKINV